MVINGTDSFAVKPDARLIKLLLRVRRFNATLAQGEGVPFAALADREGVSRSYFTRLVRLSYLAPDFTQAILDGRLAWHDQRTVLGFAQSRSEFQRLTPTLSPERSWLCPDRPGTRHHISLTAVLEFGSTETLPPVGAISKHPGVSADAVAKPSAQTRAESRVLDLRKRLRERDRLCLGGRWIRTSGPSIIQLGGVNVGRYGGASPSCLFSTRTSHNSGPRQCYRSSSVQGSGAAQRR
jgi:hypothetical protein